MNAKEHLTGVMVEFEGVIGEGAGRARGGRAASCGNEEAIGGCGSQVVDTDVIWHRLMKGRKRETERVKRENRKHRRRGGGERGRRREGGGAVLMTCVICIWRMRAISCFMLGFFWHGRLKRDGTGVLSQCNDSICTHSLPLSLSPSLPLSLSPSSLFLEIISRDLQRIHRRMMESVTMELDAVSAWLGSGFYWDPAENPWTMLENLLGLGASWKGRIGEESHQMIPVRWLLWVVDDCWWFLMILGDSWWFLKGTEAGTRRNGMESAWRY